jgi:superoxide dismutase
MVAILDDHQMPRSGCYVARRIGDKKLANSVISNYTVNTVLEHFFSANAKIEVNSFGSSFFTLARREKSQLFYYRTSNHAVNTKKSTS